MVCKEEGGPHHKHQTSTIRSAVAEVRATIEAQVKAACAPSKEAEEASQVIASKVIEAQKSAVEGAHTIKGPAAALDVAVPIAFDLHSISSFGAVGGPGMRLKFSFSSLVRLCLLCCWFCPSGAPVIVECKGTPTYVALSWKPANADGKAQAPSIKAYAVELARIGDPKSGGAVSGSAGSEGGGSSTQFAQAYLGSAPSCAISVEPHNSYLLRVRACSVSGVWGAFCSPVKYSTPSPIRFEAAGSKVQLTGGGCTASCKGRNQTALTKEFDTTSQKVLLFCVSALCISLGVDLS